jgi:creatinine amidohydrolase/Fe(II)-dependent formamide hydrolase-like protein
MRKQWLGLVLFPLLTVSISAQQPPPAGAAQQGQAGQAGQAAQAGQGRGGGRGQQTPEQREAAAKEAYDREAALPRPVPARDSVWIEELTYLEVRDAMKAGKTTALVMAGSTEQNGPYMSGGKHQYAIKLVGEAVARKLGNALIAPIIPIEAGNPDNKYLEWGSIYFTAETFQAVVRDIATSLKSQGFKNIVLLGDSGGDTAGLRAVAQELSAKWGDSPRIVHVPEYYNWTSQGGVRDFVINTLGIPEKQSEGIHDEYGLSTVMMAFDPGIVRFDDRVKAKKASINSISLEPKAKAIADGKKIVEFRATVAVEAIKKALAGGGTPAPQASAAPAANPASASGASSRPIGGAALDQRHDLRALRGHGHEGDDQSARSGRVPHGAVGLHDDVRQQRDADDGLAELAERVGPHDFGSHGLRSPTATALTAALPVSSQRPLAGRQHDRHHLYELRRRRKAGQRDVRDVRADEITRVRGSESSRARGFRRLSGGGCPTTGPKSAHYFAPAVCNRRRCRGRRPRYRARPAGTLTA